MVFGVLSVLACLGRLRVREDQELESLSIEFAAPIFVGAPYQVRVVEETETHVRARIVEGAKVVLKLAASFRARPAGSKPLPSPTSRQAAPRPSAAVRDLETIAQGQKLSGEYSAADPALRSLIRRLELDRHGVTATNVAVLMGMSYLVGMEMPGERALFSSLKADFGSGASQGSPWTFEATVKEVDSRFARIGLGVHWHAAGATVARGELSAFVRGVIEAPTPERLAQQLAPSDRLSGRIAVVSGASRGLGASIAVALASQGCRVLACYQHSDEQMRALVDAATGLPGAIVPCKGDAASAPFWQQLARQVVESEGRLDFLICNASPPLRALALDDASVDRAISFVKDGFAMVARPIGLLLPLIEKQRGSVVLVSSVAVREVVKDWPQYVATKSATEGLFRTLAAGSRHADFLIYRPPRLHTDAMNTPLGASDSMSPDVVAARIARALGDRGPGTGQLLVEELSSPPDNG